MIEIDGTLTIEDVVAVALDREQVTLANEAAARMRESRAVVTEIVDGEESVYGVNTGFGDLQDVSISRSELGTLQENVFRSHATAIGDPLPVDIVRAAMLVRANALAVGVSGVRVALVEQLIALLNKGVHPIVPTSGSTDDLGAAAHIGLVLIGDGEAQVEPGGEHLDGATALSRTGIEPLSLAPKEGLAAISGTPIMTGSLALAIHDAERLVRTADLVAAWTFSLLGNEPGTFAERVSELRPHEGQATTAANVRRLLASDLNGRETSQDPLSLRCIPQIHGAARDQLSFAHEVVETELRSATDNPLVFSDGEVFSCGNFNGQQVASAADMLATSLVKLGSIAESRTNKLVGERDEEIAFLAANPGLESGMMVAHYTSTGLLAESGTMDGVSGRSVTVSAGQEDIHSMGTIATHNLRETIKRMNQILAIELLCAMRYTRLAEDARLSGALERTFETVIETVDVNVHDDTPLYEQIQEMASIVADGVLLDAPRRADVELD